MTWNVLQGQICSGWNFLLCHSSSPTPFIPFPRWKENNNKWAVKHNKALIHVQDYVRLSSTDAASPPADPPTSCRGLSRLAENFVKRKRRPVCTEFGVGPFFHCFIANNCGAAWGGGANSDEGKEKSDEESRRGWERLEGNRLQLFRERSTAVMTDCLTCDESAHY